jgi:hypothetical protein
MHQEYVFGQIRFHRALSIEETVMRRGPSSVGVETEAATDEQKRARYNAVLADLPSKLDTDAPWSSVEATANKLAETVQECGDYENIGKDPKAPINEALSVLASRVKEVCEKEGKRLAPLEKEMCRIYEKVPGQRPLDIFNGGTGGRHGWSLLPPHAWGLSAHMSGRLSRYLKERGFEQEGNSPSDARHMYNSVLYSIDMQEEAIARCTPEIVGNKIKQAIEKAHAEKGSGLTSLNLSCLKKPKPFTL